MGEERVPVRVVDAEGRPLRRTSTPAVASPRQATIRAIGYVRLSQLAEDSEGLGLLAQRSRIREEARRRGWELVQVFEDVASGGSTRNRPGLDAAVAAIESGEAGFLIVARLDRLSRSVYDFVALMQRSRRYRWEIVALDLGVDTSTPAGQMVWNVLASFAEYERQMISQRTREALAVKKAQGCRLGRPPLLSEDVRRRVLRLHRRGLSLRAIAARLNAEGVPAAAGGQWRHTSVREVVLRAERSAEQAAA